MLVMTTMNDLRNWVDTHVGDNVTDVEKERIARELQMLPNCPRFGNDWSEYFASFSIDDLLEFAQRKAVR